MEIRNMTAAHREAVLDMMRVFYASPAVLSNGSEEIFENDISACVSGSPYLEGYVFAEGEKLCGYAMVAKSFSTEFGKPCKWIEDLYVLPDSRGKGFGTKFFAFLERKYPESILHLEVEEENEGAMKMYARNGFDVLPYTQMKKNA